MRITILGCGGSLGVPHIGADWGACDSEDARNRRSRASILVEKGSTRILVDTSPDLRGQLLAAGIGTVDAVLFTHAHGDHVHGLNDLRAVNMNLGGPLPVYADAKTLGRIRQMFGYAFEPLSDSRHIYRPWLEPAVEIGEEPFMIGDLSIEPFEQDHGYSTSLGFRFDGRAVYSSDIAHFPESSRSLLTNAELWILNCFRRQPHPTHSHLAQSLAWIREVGARRGILTHLGNDLDYQATLSACPDNVEPAYDGMVINLP